MKNINPYFLFAFAAILAFSSCSKDKDVTTDPPTKNILLSRSSSGTSVNRCNRDNTGRLLSYIQSEGTAAKDSLAFTYDASGNVTVMRWLIYSASAKNEYTYDSKGKLITRLGYSTNGNLAGTTNFTYFDDRMEELRTYSDNSTNKYVYFYTPDKKNIAEFKLYGTSGKVAEESTYTYSNVKAPRIGYEQLSGYTNLNLAEKTVTTTYNNSVPNSIPVTITYTRKIIANADGYPTSVEYAASNSTVTSTTVYEYIIK